MTFQNRLGTLVAIGQDLLDFCVDLSKRNVFVSLSNALTPEQESLTISDVFGPRLSDFWKPCGSSIVRSPTFSDIPHSLTMLFAMDVACFKSLLAPVGEMNFIFYITFIAHEILEK